MYYLLFLNAFKQICLIVLRFRLRFCCILCWDQTMTDLYFMWNQMSVWWKPICKLMALIFISSPVVFCKKGISQNSQESTCARASFLTKFQTLVRQLYWKEPPTQVLFCELKNFSFCGTPLATVSEYLNYLLI